jgi:hypothetical protein
MNKLTLQNECQTTVSEWTIYYNYILDVALPEWWLKNSLKIPNGSDAVHRRRIDITTTKRKKTKWYTKYYTEN